MSKEERIEAITRILRAEYPDKCHPEVVADHIMWRLGRLDLKQAAMKFTFYVNAQKKEWHEETISYHQVINLAFPLATMPFPIFMVMYSRGTLENKEGLLDKWDEPVVVKNGMAFDVTRTVNV